MAARCNCPPETSRGRRRAKLAGSRTWSSNSAIRSARLTVQVGVDRQGFADTRADVREGVKGGIRVLKDELHPTAQRSQTCALGHGDVFAAEQDPPPRRTDEAEHQSGQGRFARTAFADESQRCASGDGEIHVVDRVHCSLATPGHADTELTGHVDQLGNRAVRRRRQRGDKGKGGGHDVLSGNAPSSTGMVDVRTPSRVSSSDRRHRLWRCSPTTVSSTASLRHASSA